MKRPPPRPDPDPLTVQIALRWQLNELGYDDRAIARLVKAGVIVRVRRGAYVDTAAWARLGVEGRYLVRSRAVQLQAKTVVALSHLAAAVAHGAAVWGFDLAETDVTRVDGKVGRREAGVRQHCGTIIEGDLLRVDGVLVTSPTRCALEATLTGSVEAALVVVCDLLHRGLTSEESLAGRFAGMDRWPESLSTGLVLRLARKELESPGEVRTWHLLFRHSIPMPEPQYPIRDERGNVIAVVDFAWPELGVYLEFDGKVKYEKHLREGERASDAVVREKRREEQVYRLTGWRCIRLTWADLEHPHRTAAMIRRMLAARAA